MLRTKGKLAFLAKPVENSSQFNQWISCDSMVLSDFSEVRECKCATTYGAAKKILADEQQQKLIHFLIHANDEYESIRGQILLLDPLPNVNKAYAMIQRVEKKMQVTGPRLLRYYNHGKRSRHNTDQCFTGPIDSHSHTFCFMSNDCLDPWIVDTGASDHVTLQSDFA